MGYPDVHITNSCGYTAAGTVHYAACSSDDFNIGNGSDWSHSRGACLITEITATVYLPSGSVPAAPYQSSGTSYSQYAVIQNPPGHFTVTRVVNFLSGNQLLAATGLATAAKFYGVESSEDLEAVALRISRVQEQKIEDNWPIGSIRPSLLKSGTLLCSLRSPENLGKEPSCVQGALEEESRNRKLGLSEADIVSVTKALLTAMIKRRGEIDFATGRHACSSGKTLCWGLSGVAEPLENGKDWVLYTFGLSLT